MVDRYIIPATPVAVEIFQIKIAQLSASLYKDATLLKRAGTPLFFNTPTISMGAARA